MRIRIYPYADQAISGQASRAARLFFYSVACLKNGEVEKIIRKNYVFYKYKGFNFQYLINDQNTHNR